MSSVEHVDQNDLDRWRQALELIDKLTELLRPDFVVDDTLLGEGASEADTIDDALDESQTVIGGRDLTDCEFSGRIAGCLLAARTEIAGRLEARERKLNPSI